MQHPRKSNKVRQHKRSEGPFSAACNIFNDLVFRPTDRQLVKCQLDFRVPLCGNENEYTQNQGCFSDVHMHVAKIICRLVLWVHFGELSQSETFTVSVDRDSFPVSMSSRLKPCNLTQIQFVGGCL